jgi:hypothetical protein
MVRVSCPNFALVPSQSCETDPFEEHSGKNIRQSEIVLLTAYVLKVCWLSGKNCWLIIVTT